MRYPERELITIMSDSGVDFTSSLPCEKIGALLEGISKTFFHVPLTREEEGIGLSAGAALSGKRPAIFVQSSGIGNMVNALLSLTGFYELPLALFISRRGVYREKIAAQIPMGRRLPAILRGAGIPYTVIDSRKELKTIGEKLPGVYKKNKIHAFLLSPAVWVRSEYGGQRSAARSHAAKIVTDDKGSVMHNSVSPKLNRFEILETIAPYLNDKVVVCNLGFPSRELFHIKHQPSHFYMLGSMGMATPIGLGIALASKRQVVVIEGDGSLLMNPGTLATASYFAPRNLTIFVVDNGAYGSTGNQPTFAGSCVDLSLVAKGFGVGKTIKISKRKQLIDSMKARHNELTFIHALAVPGNRDVPNIQLGPLEIKSQVQDFLKRQTDTF